MAFLLRYKYSLLLVASLVVLCLIADSDPVKNFVFWVGSFGYLGAFFTGIFFTISFTVAPAGLILFHLAENLNPVLMSLVAGFGALIGDLLVLRFMKDALFVELAPLAKKLGGEKLACLCSTPLCGWMMALIGGLIIASPFPDEAGVALLGYMQVGGIKFSFISFFFNTLGILVIALSALAIA